MQMGSHVFADSTQIHLSSWPFLALVSNKPPGDLSGVSKAPTQLWGNLRANLHDGLKAKWSAS